MQSLSVISAHDLEQARTRVAQMIADHCRSGRQTMDLKDTSVASCGQFVGNDHDHPAVTQRGLHGTAAAIAVLARSGSEVRDTQMLLDRLLRYAESRHKGEANAGNPLPASHIDRDETNVIKLSELLYAVSFVAESNSVAARIRKRLVARLKAMAVNNGWPYFSGTPDARPHLLPTAHAVLALSAVRETPEPAIQYLENSLRGDSAGAKNGIDEADISIRVFALYVLVFASRFNAGTPVSAELRTRFEEMWRRTSKLLGSECIEQNIEYGTGSETFYVRVPWQLYMLALAARVRFKRFATVSAQGRLRSIVSSMKAGEFRYPHSGSQVSTRTNAIAHEVCGRILEERDRWSGLSWRVAADAVRTSPWLRRIALLICIGIAGWSLIAWFLYEFSVAGLAPELVGAVVIGVLVWSMGGIRD